MPVMSMTDPRLIARHYQQTRERILATLADPGVDWNAPVPACPEWSARDVVAHLTAVAEDWFDGTLTGPPTDDQTAAQVARFDGWDQAGIISAWTAAAERLDQYAETAGVAPPLGDIACHEHDVRGAIDRSGARDSDAVWHASDQLLTILQTPVPLRIFVEDADYRTGPDGGNQIRLRSTRFETLRWRTGRRSRAQLAAMDWSEDPAPILDHLYLFGPSEVDIIE
jgi:uncharacterized damage-inducible protein DinB